MASIRCEEYTAFRDALVEIEDRNPDVDVDGLSDMARDAWICDEVRTAAEAWELWLVGAGLEQSGKET